MQKVSKQSLAMIALSILLAISIALTFTFAALAKTQTATGTITFNGDVGIVFGGLTSGADELTFKVEYAADGNYTLSNVNTATTDKSKIDDGIEIRMATGSAKGKVTAKISYLSNECEINTNSVLTAASKLVVLEKETVAEQAKSGELVCKVNSVFTIKDMNTADLTDQDYTAIYDEYEKFDKVVITFSVKKVDE